MRFTKIPLIATLMAVALSLLIVLPALGQYADNTDGKRGSGDLEVGVFADIADAQKIKMQKDDTYGAYYPVDTVTGSLGTGADVHNSDDEAYLANPVVSPQDTAFNGKLYVSNSGSGHNVVLINVMNDGTTIDSTCMSGEDSSMPHMTATVKNNRASDDGIKVQLVYSAGTGDNSGNSYFQAFFKVVEEGDKGMRSAGSAGTGEAPFKENDGPTWCADLTKMVHADDDDNSDTPKDNDQDDDLTTPDDRIREENVATSAVYGPVVHDPKRQPEEQQEIATIFAGHGDTITVEVGSSSIELTVDGEGPEFSAVTPEDNAVTRESKLILGFEVRDEDSGLRHDGEAVMSPDGDYRLVNADKDHDDFDEPLSTKVTRGNGKSRDIDVNVLPCSEFTCESGDLTLPDKDMSDTGTWEMVGNRAGVAYAFTAKGSGDGAHLYQLVAKDRAGNKSTSDADRDMDDDQPYVFRVDDADPVLSSARTGISYNTEKDAEEVDLSFIALEFNDGRPNGDAIDEVNTDYITVVGHTIVGVVHPSEAPRIRRGDSAESLKPSDPSGDGGRPSDCGEETPTDKLLCDKWATYDTDLDSYMKDHYPATTIGDDGVVRIVEPRSRIYLELADELAADEKPTVVLVSGAVTDLAGNENESGNKKAEDWIAPTLTVTVTGTGMSADKERQVANGDGSFTIEVRSNEDVNRRPTVHFVRLMATAITDKDGDPTGEYEKERIADAASASSLTQQEDENHWSKTYDADTIFGGDKGIIGIVVLTEDSEENSGATKGWTPKPNKHRNAMPPATGNALDFEKLDDAGLLIEIDADFNGGFEEDDGGGPDADDDGNREPIGAVTPRSSGSMETESANPFVKLTFGGEKGEYKADGLEETHNSVEITEITLNGDDAMDRLNRVGAAEFSLVVRDLEIGDHSVKYTAEDDAGNEAEFEFEFSRVEREPYEIDVKPGWNLISLPATPVESAIGDVFSGNEYISPVVGYQNGDWVTAVQEEDGTWRGRLETIQGGYGYWVLARTFSTIETMLSQVDPAGTLPTVPVTNGWNLLGVLDIYQNAAGDPPGVAKENGDEADNYFSSIPWRVAYTYTTDTSAWTKTTPKTDTIVEGRTVDDLGSGNRKIEVKEGAETVEKVATQEILNGMGYWVWSSEPSTLVP